MERDGNSSMSERDQEEEEEEAELLKGAIEVDYFRCDVCDKPLMPPVFQCSEGDFFLCSSCRDDQHECMHCAGRSSIERNHGMDRAVRSILVDCRYADQGCQERTLYFEKESHEKVCPRAPCSCPYSGCGFAGAAVALLDHLTAHHKCLCTEFNYWVQFDLRVEPGVIQVLHCKDDGQLILMSTQPAEPPPGYAISMVCAPSCIEKSGVGCSVSLDSFSWPYNYYGTWTKYKIPNLSQSDWPPTDGHICIVPKLSGNIELKIIILCANAADDEDGISYIESEEDSDDSS